MKPLLALLTALAAATPAAAQLSDILTWKSTAGSSLEAELIAIEDDEITLATAAGKRLKLRTSQLDPTSLKQLESLTGGGIKQNEGWLPTYTKGPMKGTYAFFQNDAYEARVTQRGTIQIFIRENGKRTSNRYIHLRPGLGFVRNKEWLGRPIESASAKNPPALQPEKVTVNGLARDGVKWQFTYEFEPDRIIAWGSVKDPGGLDQPTVCQISTSTPEYKELDYTKTQAEMNAVVGKSILTVDSDNGKPVKYDYITKVDLGKDIREKAGVAAAAHAKSEHFGSRTIHWEPSDPTRHGRLLFYTQGTAALFEGYSIYYRNHDARSNSRKSHLALTIE